MVSFFLSVATVSLAIAAFIDCLVIRSLRTELKIEKGKNARLRMELSHRRLRS